MQTAFCAFIAFAVTALSGFYLVPLLRKLKFGQTILDIGPNWHKSKEGTPTMGGVMFALGIFVAVLTAFWFLKDSDPTEKIRLASGFAMAIGYGFLGTNPFALGRVMRKHGFEVTRISEADMTEQGLYIFSFWIKKPWLSSAHTVAVKSDGQKLIAYNLSGTGYLSRLRPEQYAGRILCVYRIKKL